MQKCKYLQNSHVLLLHCTHRWKRQFAVHNANQHLFSSERLEVMNALKEWIKSLTDYHDGERLIS